MAVVATLLEKLFLVGIFVSDLDETGGVTRGRECRPKLSSLLGGILSPGGVSSRGESVALRKLPLFSDSGTSAGFDVETFSS